LKDGQGIPFVFPSWVGRSDDYFPTLPWLVPPPRKNPPFVIGTAQRPLFFFVAPLRPVSSLDCISTGLKSIPHGQGRPFLLHTRGPPGPPDFLVSFFQKPHLDRWRRLRPPPHTQFLENFFHAVRGNSPVKDFVGDSPLCLTVFSCFCSLHKAPCLPNFMCACRESHHPPVSPSPEHPPPPPQL